MSVDYYVYRNACLKCGAEWLRILRGCEASDRMRIGVSGLATVEGLDTCPACQHQRVDRVSPIVRIPSGILVAWDERPNPGPMPTPVLSETSFSKTIDRPKSQAIDNGGVTAAKEMQRRIT